MGRVRIKLNGTIKVGLGQSPYGKILDRNTQCVHFYCSHENEEKQIDKLKTALGWHKENGKPMFYSHNCKAYQEIDETWILDRIKALQTINK